MKRVSNTVVFSVIAVIAFAWCAGDMPSAYAQAPWYVPAPANAGAPASPEPVAPRSDTPRVDDSGPYSPGTAFTLSLLGTATGYGLLTLAANRESEGLAWAGIAGVMIGPSMGHIYTGESNRAIGHTALRGLGGALMVAGLAFGLDDSGNGPPANPYVLMTGGFVLHTVMTVYSMADAPRSARRVNRRLQQLEIAPTPIIGPDHSTGVGLTLGGNF